jgi:nucleoside 2-deoxyribosyltransferase
MKAYIASSFGLVPKVERVAAMLEDMGHTITVKWWLPQDRKFKDLLGPKTPEEFYAHPKCRFFFERDFKGVKDADILVFVADDVPRAYNGANVELGIALGDGKICFSVGRLDNSALYWLVVKCQSDAELRQIIGEAQRLQIVGEGRP